MSRARKTHLRPTDIAWQAYQAGANEVSAVFWRPEDLNAKFKEWWAAHPQTLPDGQLKEEPPAQWTRPKTKKSRRSSTKSSSIATIACTTASTPTRRSKGR